LPSFIDVDAEGSNVQISRRCPEVQVALVVVTGRKTRPTESLEFVANRYDLCEDMRRC